MYCTVWGQGEINGNFRILKWRYCTIFLAIFSRDIPLYRPYIGLMYGRYLQSIGSWNGHWSKNWINQLMEVPDLFLSHPDCIDAPIKGIRWAYIRDIIKETSYRRKNKHLIGYFMWDVWYIHPNMLFVLLNSAQETSRNQELQSGKHDEANLGIWKTHFSNKPSWGICTDGAWGRPPGAPPCKHAYIDNVLGLDRQYLTIKWWGASCIRFYRLLLRRSPQMPGRQRRYHQRGACPPTRSHCSAPSHDSTEAVARFRTLMNAP